MIGPAICLENVTCTHDRHPAVHHARGVFAPGSLTALVGPNGAGKTTLLRAIAGLHRVDEGRIDRGGLALSQIALLPQPNGLDRAFPVSCRDVAALGAYARAGALRAIDGAVVSSALAKVGLAGFERRLIGTLSAGQLQRLLFARLIVQDAPAILLDEPFNAVDARTTADLLQIMRQWHEQGRLIIAVVHDLDLAARAFPTTLLMARDVIAWGDTRDVLSPEHRLRARLVAEAWDETAPLCSEAA